MADKNRWKRGQEITPRGYLLAALAKLARKDGWTQGCFARDANGEHVCSLDPIATCWCADGAILSLPPGNRRFEAIAALERVIPPGYSSVANYNDDKNTTLQDIFALYVRAIASLPAGAP